MAGEELLHAARTVTRKLAKWLGELGYLDGGAVQVAVQRGAAATWDLPRAERLSRLLFEQAQRSTIHLQALDEDDYVEDDLMTERVDPGALWFEGETGRSRWRRPPRTSPSQAGRSTSCSAERATRGKCSSRQRVPVRGR